MTSNDFFYFILMMVEKDSLAATWLINLVPHEWVHFCRQKKKKKKRGEKSINGRLAVTWLINTLNINWKMEKSDFAVPLDIMMIEQ